MQLSEGALQILQVTSKGDSGAYFASFLWDSLADFCELITGSTFDEVLETNLSKLADRKERGVIGGSGDER